MSHFKIILLSIILTVLFHEEPETFSILVEDKSDVFFEVGALATGPMEKVKLSNKILREHRWQEEAPIPNCILNMEFGRRGNGKSYGCGLIGTLNFKYSVQRDTLYVEQYRIFDTDEVPKKWMGGKYIFTGHSLLLVQATEWDSSGKANDVVIARKHEYEMK